MTPAEMQALADRSAILQAVQNWGFFRDDGNWQGLRDLYASDGLMHTTWSVLPADEFVAACRKSTEVGEYFVQHVIGGSILTLRGDKAIAETRRTLLLRGSLHGIEVDVTNYGRSYDRYVRQDGGWKIRMRTGIYEKDRIDPVDPAERLELDAAKLALYPDGYRHMAYFQAANGARITADLPTAQSAARARLYAEGQAWLAAD